MIKIIGGIFKGTTLEVSPYNVRPTSAFKRESIFSIIDSYAIKNSINFYKKKAFLDIFAGTGSIGLEAISRGMEKVFFYEKDKKVLEILKKNCVKICKKNQFRIFVEDAMNTSFSLIDYKISLIFIDPPYFKYNISELLQILLKNKIINKETIIIVEESAKTTFNISHKLKIINKKTYGKTIINFLMLR